VKPYTGSENKILHGESCSQYISARTGKPVTSDNSYCKRACTIAHGPAPKDKPFTLHECDNGEHSGIYCVTGSHLRWGTQKDNMQECSRKGRVSRLGNPHPCSEETKKKLSKFNRNKKLTEEHKNKISIANMGTNNGMYGHKYTAEELKVLSEATKGNKNGMFGYIWSKEQREVQSHIFKNMKHCATCTHVQKCKETRGINGYRKACNEYEVKI
jgi:hypothetical protein